MNQSGISVRSQCRVGISACVLRAAGSLILEDSNELEAERLDGSTDTIDRMQA
jgi:hypothetical protein